MRPSDKRVLRDYCNRRLFIKPSLWDRFCMWMAKWGPL